MLVSLKWLSQYVDISALSADDLAEKITRAGIEVDAVIDRASGMDNVVIGHVVSKEKHPEADKLNVCQVDVGEEELQQIVCGKQVNYTLSIYLVESYQYRFHDCFN